MAFKIWDTPNLPQISDNTYGVKNWNTVIWVLLVFKEILLIDSRLKTSELAIA